MGMQECDEKNRFTRFLLLSVCVSRSARSSWLTCAWWSSPRSSRRRSSESISWCRSSELAVCPPARWRLSPSRETATRNSSSWCVTSCVRLAVALSPSTTRSGVKLRLLVEGGAEEEEGSGLTEAGGGSAALLRVRAWFYTNNHCVYNMLYITYYTCHKPCLPLCRVTGVTFIKHEDVQHYHW